MEKKLIDFYLHPPPPPPSTPSHKKWEIEKTEETGWGKVISKESVLRDVDGSQRLLLEISLFSVVRRKIASPNRKSPPLPFGTGVVWETVIRTQYIVAVGGCGIFKLVVCLCVCVCVRMCERV